MSVTRSLRAVALVALATAAGCSNNGSPAEDAALPEDLAADHGSSGWVVVSELMVTPAATAKEKGQWIELFNPTANEVELGGWTLKDGHGESHTLQGPLRLGGGKYLVLARNKDAATNGGVTAAYQYSGLALESADQVALVDGSGQEIDRVAWSAGWPLVNGASLELRDPALDNGLPASWCTALTLWAGSAGDKGSPGEASSCASKPKDAGVRDGSSTKDGSGKLDGIKITHSLSFNESLCASITNNTKKTTLRNKHNVAGISVGEWIKLICSTSKTTFKAQVTLVRLTTWGGITAEEYMADGFSSQAQMLQIMQTYYPGITMTDPATVYAWDKSLPYP